MAGLYQTLLPFMILAEVSRFELSLHSINPHFSPGNLVAGKASGKWRRKRTRVR
jgi:hypothetical protein